VSEDLQPQADAAATPGSMLRSAREAQGLGAKEVEERLHWMPGYVAIVERDDYQALRRPAFARGYVRAYGKLLGLEEAALLALLDERQPAPSPGRAPACPQQLQRTGIGVAVGIGVMLLVVLALWWWRGERGVAAADAAPVATSRPLAPGGEAGQ